MRTFAPLALFAAATLIACADAKPPAYVGTWKVNLAESDFGQLTVTYEAAEGGGFKTTMDGQSYTFKTDGSPSATPWGNTVTVKNVDSTTWAMVTTLNDKLLSTDTMKISADNKMMTIVSHAMQATGTTANNTLSLTRSAGEKGLVGVWKADKMNSSAPSTVQIAQSGADGIALKFVEIQGECTAQFDGKDAPATGPMWASGWTCSAQKKGDTAFELSVKKDGTPMYVSTYTASADGKKLTEEGGSVATTEKVKVVYDRQS